MAKGNRVPGTSHNKSHVSTIWRKEIMRCHNNDGVNKNAKSPIGDEQSPESSYRTYRTYRSTIPREKDKNVKSPIGDFIIS